MGISLCWLIQIGISKNILSDLFVCTVKQVDGLPSVIMCNHYQAPEERRKEKKLCKWPCIWYMLQLYEFTVICFKERNKGMYKMYISPLFYFGMVIIVHSTEITYKMNVTLFK